MQYLIMSYSPKEQSLCNRENNTSIKGSWLYELAVKYNPDNVDRHIKRIGVDKINRIEIEISVPLFEKLKTDFVFINYATNLRRLRLKKERITLIQYLCYPIANFDNDLDSLATV